MYIDIIPNRNSRPAILLRESVREGKRIIKRTIANLSALSLQQAEAIRAVLKGEALAPADGPFEIIRSRPHGAVKAITAAMSRLRLATLLDRKPSHERDLVLAMIAARVLDPQSKLATSRSWGHSTLGESFGVEGRTRMRCMRRLTGCSSARMASSSGWPSGTWRMARGCSMTSPRATSRGSAVRWPNVATRAMARRAPCR